MKKILLALLLAFHLSAGAQVSSAPPGLVLIQRQVVSGVNTVSFTAGITSRFDVYVIKMAKVVLSGGDSGIAVRFSADGGGSYFAGATDYLFQYSRNSDVPAVSDVGSGATGQAQMQMNGSPYAALSVFNGELMFFNPADTINHAILFRYVFLSGTGVAESAQGGGVMTVNTAAVNAIRIFGTNASTSISGAFALYGVRKQ